MCLFLLNDFDDLVAGTGKTLSLLCAALAWREAFVAQLQLNSKVSTNESEFMKGAQETLDLAVGFGITNKSQAIPKIIYASRTHSQLSQAVNELKNTSYKPRISVLGSRDQMCINHDVNRLEDNNAKVFACRVKLSTRSCTYYNNVEANLNNKEFKNEILDIEDIGKLGNKHAVCPYFMSRELRTEAELIFMPYNYVLDFKLRQTNSIDLKNAIILLDEAHNVEKICEEAASFELTTFDLANAQDNCDECRKILEERKGALGEGFDEGSIPETGITEEDTMKLKDVFNKIEKIVMEPELTQKNPKKVAKAEFLFDALNKQSIDASNVNSIIDAIDQCNTLLASQANIGAKRKQFALPKMSEVFKTLFCYSDQPSNLNFEVGRFYKVVIRLENAKLSNKKAGDVWERSSADEKPGRTLSYWCFHAGVSMKEIMKQGTRSLILTSGTLSPLESFTSELDVPFPVTLQNPHVIGSNQIWTGIITKGPDGIELNSSYHKRSTSEYQNSLGNLLVNLSRSTPHGLLVFFPSYFLMDEMIKAWNQNGILDRISQCKPHFAEPKDKKSLATQMEMFYEKINDPNHKGAIFFAVCRGKVSEGLDFADKNGRVVVITGLPYPPKMDAKVELKMQFLDNNCSKGKLSGNQWYTQQASRAVNQAVGRVIRHNKDFGAILLCDVRFTYPDAISRLPIWIKPHVRTYHDFGQAHRNIIMFFKNIENLFSPPKIKMKSDLKSEQVSVNQFKKKSSQLESSSKMKQSSVAIHRNRMVDARDSFNSNATSSLAAIKANESAPVKAGLFQSLSRQTGRKEKEEILLPRSKMSSTIIGRSHDAVKSKPKTKKFKLVSNNGMKKEESNKDEIKDVKNEKSTEDVNKRQQIQTVDKNPPKNIKDARQYITVMRSVFSKEDYDKFAKILFNYTKKEDMKSLIENLTALFDKKLDQIHLFKGFESFIKKEKDKKLFHRAYQHLVACTTQKDCPSTSKDASVILGKPKQEVLISKKGSHVPNMEPALKKPKLSLATALNDDNSVPISDFFPILSDDDSEEEDKVSHLRCIVCADDVKAPYQAPCGHIACHKCWYYQFKNAKACPKCKNCFREKQLIKLQP